MKYYEIILSKIKWLLITAEMNVKWFGNRKEGAEIYSDWQD